MATMQIRKISRVRRRQRAYAFTAGASAAGRVIGPATVAKYREQALWAVLGCSTVTFVLGLGVGLVFA